MGDPFLLELSQSGWSNVQQEAIVNTLVQSKLYSHDDVSGAEPLLSICRDLSASEMSQMLIRDFRLEPLLANQIRMIVMKVLARTDDADQALESEPRPSEEQSQPLPLGLSTKDNLQATEQSAMETTTKQQPLTVKYKAAIVNQAAVRRKQQKDTYQLDTSSYPQLQQQLDQFFRFMTEPSTISQEDPIRPATANVYLLHAKLFLGWYVRHQEIDDSNHAKRIQLSLHDIFVTKEKESATIIIQFVMWLRKERHISVSYEANVLRGMVKLLKFRFAEESVDGDNRRTYEDIPIIQELRKLHRNANKQAKLAPKSSNEGQKWLSWPEFLEVVQATRNNFELLLKECMDTSSPDKGITPLQRQVAVAFQKYLVLAVFTSVPDRQRTIRELEIGRTLVREESGSDCWFIKHNPADYKTGAAYGERPPMLLSQALSKDIDNFIDNWRSKLEPKTEMLFVQQRTGNPLTRDSVYSIVSRACYEHAGKRTNPHLLRDMIVTHVRESNASEKELEALALFMGHSIHMQRTSYDRRTLERKVAPAIKLLELVNSEQRRDPGE